MPTAFVVRERVPSFRFEFLVTQRDGKVSAVVEDDGEGFDPSSSPPQGGFGLVGMRERLALVGGRVRIESRGDGSGTTIAVEVPVE